MSKITRTKRWEGLWGTQTIVGSMSEEERDLEIQAEVSRLASKKGVESLKKAVWQYLSDHTTPHPKGYAIHFMVRNKNDFWWRVEQRRTGKFIRHDQKAVSRKVANIIWGNARRSALDKVIAGYAKTGPWWLRSMIFIRGRMGRYIEALAQEEVNKSKFPLFPDDMMKEYEE